MAVHIFCTACKTSNGLEAKECSKCGAVFGRDRKYRVCASVKGKRVTRVCDNLTIAREAEAAIKADLLRDEFDISNHKVTRIPTLDELWRKYLPWAREHKKSWVTDKYNYETHLEPRFGKKALDAITSFDIERMRLELKRNPNRQGRPYTQATIKHQIVLLKRLYNLAKRWGMFGGENPVSHVEIPRLDNRKTEFLTEDEVERLLKTLNEWPYLETAHFIKFAMFTGLRRGEIFKLTWDSVDFERSLITLKEPKGGTTQTIPISAAALSILKGIERSSEFIFPGKDGKQRTDFKGPWKRIRKAAGLPDNFRFHGLRHHFASTLVSSGIDLCVVQALLTHKDARTTARYSHLAPNALKEAARKSAELIQAKETKIVELNR